MAQPHPLSLSPPFTTASPLGAHLKEDEEGEPGCEDVPELRRVAVVIGVPVVLVPAAQPRGCWHRALCALHPALAPPWVLRGAASEPSPPLLVPRLDVPVRGSGMLLGNGFGLLLPALCDVVGDKARWHLGQLCVELEVLDAEGGQAVVDVTGGAAAGDTVAVGSWLHQGCAEPQATAPGFSSTQGSLMAAEPVWLQLSFLWLPCCVGSRVAGSVVEHGL